jgi:hypothetical protein
MSMEAREKKVETALLSALKRLQDGNPDNPSLARKAKLGKLRINPSTVAQEAGCSRTLIGHDGCAYSEIRKQILKGRDTTVKPATSFEDINRNLRHENRNLKDAVNLSMSRVAAMLLQRDETLAEAELNVDEVKRQLAHVLEMQGAEPKANVHPISNRKKRT